MLEVLKKLFKVFAQTGIRLLAIVGGVSANSELRRRFLNECEAKDCQGFIPPFALCTDNAAMIAIAGQHLFQAGLRAGIDSIPFSSS